MIYEIIDRIKRNKYKLIGLSGLLGYLWYSYGSTIRQALQLYRLMSAQAADEGRGDVSGTEEAFEVSDEISFKQFLNIKSINDNLYFSKIQNIQISLKSEKNSINRLNAFNELNGKAFQQILTSVISGVTFFIISRAEVSVISGGGLGRPRDPSEKSLLSSLTDYEKLELVISNVSELVNNSFLRVFDLTPTTLVSSYAEILRPLLEVVESAVPSALEEFARLVPTSDCHCVKATLDILESPQIAAVVNRCVSDVLRLGLEESVGSEKAPFPVAKSIAGILTQNVSFLELNDKYLNILINSKLINELSQTIFTSQVSSANFSQPSELRHMIESLARIDSK